MNSKSPPLPKRRKGFAPLAGMMMGNTLKQAGNQAPGYWDDLARPEAFGEANAVLNTCVSDTRPNDEAPGT
jgi:hypothetical protein